MSTCICGTDLTELEVTCWFCHMRHGVSPSGLNLDNYLWHCNQCWPMDCNCRLSI